MNDIEIVRRVAELKLSEKEKLFAEEFVKCFDVGKAGRRVWNKSTTIKHLESILEKPNVKEYLKILIEQVSSRINLSTEQIIKEYMSIAFANMNDFIDWTDRAITLKPTTAIDPDKFKVISEVSQDARGNIRLKLHPKLDALEALMRFKNLDMPKDPKKPSTTKFSIEKLLMLFSDGPARNMIEKAATEAVDLKQLPDMTDKVERALRTRKT